MMFTKTNWIEEIDRLGPEMAARAREADQTGRFVHANYELLRDAGAMAAAVPLEFGGGGASHAELCEMIRRLAHYCPSTSLAFSMHAHLVAATVWKVRNGNGGEPLLRRIAQDQIVLLSTGGSDWVDSNGTMQRTEGGYRVSAHKIFGSGSPVADLMITSARYEHPTEGWQVLHFPVPMDADGVEVQDDWNSCGMRATGSNPVLLRDVFVPDEAIALTRPAGRWHPVWSMVVTVAFPVFLAPYVGIAERAREMAVAEGRRRWSHARDPHLVQLLGELDNHLMSAQLAWQDMIRTANDYDFENRVENANRTLGQKILLTRACVAAVQKALEATGGRGFHRGFGLEQLLRDVMAGPFHPLPEKRQADFGGRMALGLDPITGEPLAAQVG